MRQTQFQREIIPRLNMLGNAGVDTILEIEVSSEVDSEDRQTLISAFETLSEFLGNKMKLTVSSGGGGGQPFTDDPTESLSPRKGGRK